MSAAEPERGADRSPAAGSASARTIGMGIPQSWQATLLFERDNVAVALRDVAAGERVRVRTPEGVVEVDALEAIPLCHKIALADLAKGERIFKYGSCIGEARSTIARGAWVHIHNLASLRARLRASNAAS